MKKNQSSVQADKLKSVLITRAAIKTLVPEDIVEKVIMFQFKDARAQVQIHEQIEIGGFGKLITSPAKIRKRIEKLERNILTMKEKRENMTEEVPEKRLAYWNKSAIATKEMIDYLRTKKGGNESKH